VWTLHDFSPSGNGYKVRLRLRELGVPFAYREIDIAEGSTLLSTSSRGRTRDERKRVAGEGAWRTAGIPSLVHLHERRGHDVTHVELVEPHRQGAVTHLRGIGAQYVSWRSLWLRALTVLG
jgi:hypothetical protein